MLSFPSSLQSSIIEDKENLHPNFKSTKDSDGSPSNIKKYKAGNKSMQLPRCQSENQNSFRKQQPSCPNTNNSLKHLLQYFGNSKAIEENEKNQDDQSSQDNQTKFQPHKLTPNYQQIFINNNIKSTSRNINKQKSVEQIEHILYLKSQLLTDLGKLKIHQICKSLNQNQSLTQEQNQIISILLNNSDEQDIKPDILAKKYEIYQQQADCEKDFIKELSQQFNYLKKTKIQPKLMKEHFRLQITNALRYYQRDGNIDYNSLCKIFGNMLNKKQILIIFRYLYYMETNTILTMFDPTWKVNYQFLLANLFGNNKAFLQPPKFQQINKRYVAAQLYISNSKIKKLEKNYSEVIKNKDNEIQKLKKTIDLMKIQKETELSLYREIIKKKEQAFKEQYNKKINKLINSKNEQRRLNEWYQDELQYIVKQVNRENVVLKFLRNS